MTLFDFNELASSQIGIACLSLTHSLDAQSIKLKIVKL